MSHRQKLLTKDPKEPATPEQEETQRLLDEASNNHTGIKQARAEHDKASAYIYSRLANDEPPKPASGNSSKSSKTKNSDSKALGNKDNPDKLKQAQQKADEVKKVMLDNIRTVSSGKKATTPNASSTVQPGPTHPVPTLGNSKSDAKSEPREPVQTKQPPESPKKDLRFTLEEADTAAASLDKYQKLFKTPEVKPPEKEPTRRCPSFWSLCSSLCGNTNDAKEPLINKSQQNKAGI